MKKGPIVADNVIYTMKVYMAKHTLIRPKVRIRKGQYTCHASQSSYPRSITSSWWLIDLFIDLLIDVLIDYLNPVISLVGLTIFEQKHDLTFF